MTRRPVLLGLLVWVTVVAVASVIAWTVIDSAGEQALFDAGQMPPLPQPSATAASASASARAGTPSPTAPQSSADGSPSTSRTSPPADSSAPSAYTERSWQGVVGVVVARCTGSAISLRSATPSDAYRVEVGSRGPAEVEVKFEGGGREVKVRAECAGGTPAFEQESGESSED